MPSTEADRRVGSRAASLAEDALRAGEADDGIDRQEIGRVGELADQPQLVVERTRTSSGRLSGAPFRRAGPGQLLQRLLRGEEDPSPSSGYW